MFLNNTSQYNSRLVRQIIRYAANVIPIDDVMINVKNSKYQYGGMAYSHLPYGPFSKQTPYPQRKSGKRPRYLVVCRIGAPQKFPFQCSGYPGRKIENGNLADSTVRATVGSPAISIYRDLSVHWLQARREIRG